jgi:ABC-type xylose transport system permease subunit
MNVEGLQIFSFVLMGLLAGLAGILYASQGIVLGGVLVAAVAIDAIVNRKRVP